MDGRKGNYQFLFHFKNPYMGPSRHCIIGSFTGSCRIIALFNLHIFFPCQPVLDNNRIEEYNRIHTALSKKYLYLSSMNALLKLFEKEEFVSAGMNDIKMNESGYNISASVSVRKLSRLIQSFDSRLNILVSFFLNGLFLWDFHCINKLENWKSAYKNHFPAWLEMIGR